jgi:amino acid transporter
VRWKPFRITELWAKVAYVLVSWYFAPISLRFLLGAAAIHEAVVVAVDVALSFAVVGLGVRAFRARGEAVQPPRVWWRATGRPAAGFVLFALFVLAVMSNFVPPATDDPFLWWYVLTGVPIAAFYLHSSIRLAHGDAPVPPRPRKDDDLRLIERRKRL